MSSNINTLSNNNGIPGGNNPNMMIDCGNLAKNFWNSIPLFVKFISVCTCVLYFFNLFLPFISLYLVNIPYFTLFGFQIWRLFTTTVITTSIFNILFALVSWIKDGSNLEKSMGTLKYMFTFTINAIFIQIIYILITLLLYLITQKKEMMMMNIYINSVENAGLWPIIMAEITVLCLANPNNPVKILLFPCEIKAKYYPIMLFGLFVLFSGFRIQFDLFAGILYGVLHHYVLRNKFHISDGFVLKCENLFLFKWMKKLPGFVSCGSGLPVTIINNQPATGGPVNVVSSNESGSKFQAFRGKGVAVGGSFDSNSNDIGYQGLSQTNSSQMTG